MRMSNWTLESGSKCQGSTQVELVQVCEMHSVPTRHVAPSALILVHWKGLLLVSQYRPPAQSKSNEVLSQELTLNVASAATPRSG